MFARCLATTKRLIINNRLFHSPMENNYKNLKGTLIMSVG